MVKYERYATLGTWSEREVSEMLEKNGIQVQGECYEVIINQRFRLSVWGNLLADDSVIYNVDFYESNEANSLDMDSWWIWSDYKLSLWFDQRDDALGLVHAVAMDSVNWQY